MTQIIYPHLLSLAPMMDLTDRHFRYFLRLITRKTLLYTEMITSAAIIHGNRDKLLAYHPIEHPIALQIGGSDPKQLATCTKIAEEMGYDEVNLNVGCPSDRVQSGAFGACLMAKPLLVAECIATMQNQVSIPVTVKTRIGIDDLDSYEHLCHFIQTVAATGCKVFIIHARKAWLSGLSPKENRNIPPLRYEVVHALKKDFPQLIFILNGGIQTLEAAQTHKQNLDGIMIGRAAYENPYLFAQADQLFYQENTSVPSRIEIIQRFLPYFAQELAKGIKPSAINRHILGLFYGQKNAKIWRRLLSSMPKTENFSFALIEQNLQAMLS